MDIELILLEAEESMEIAINSYVKNLSKITTGRANPKILDSIKINYFDTLTPINQIAQISVPEPRQLLIKPYDMNINRDIVGAINSASIGVNAVDEGDKTRISFPELTTERRRDLVKSLGKYTEQAKVQVRHARQEAKKDIKKIENLSEDLERNYENEIQKLTDKYVSKIEKETETKEKDLMNI